MNRDSFFSNRAAAHKHVCLWLCSAWLSVTFCAAAQETNSLVQVVYRPLLEQSSPRSPTTVVDHLVLHFCSDVIAHPQHPYDIDRQIEIFRHNSASANYLIARDGTIYLFVPETRAAWHAGTGHLPWDPTIHSMNQRAIGIEMFAVGSPDDMRLFGMTHAQYDAFQSAHPDWVGFSDAQYASLNRLIDDIRRRHPAILPDRFHIIGHEEWAGRARRTDPGQLFDWTRIGLTRDRPAPPPPNDLNGAPK